MLGKSLKTVLDGVHFIVNLYSFPLHPVPPTSSPPGKSSSCQTKYLPYPKQNNFTTFSPYLDTSTIALMRESFPHIWAITGQIKVFNNQGMKEKRFHRSHSFFVTNNETNKKAGRICMGCRGASFLYFNTPLSKICFPQ